MNSSDSVSTRGYHPLVSVIIPTKDRLDLLKNALLSLERQTYTHWEALVVDDGSNDGTFTWFAENPDSFGRIRLLPGHKAGAAACRNQGFHESRGEYILFLDSDDLLMPSCLEDRLAVFCKFPSLDFVLGEAALFRDLPGDTRITHGGGQSQHDLERMIALHYSWQTSAPLWSKSALDHIGSWDESLRVGQDVDLTSRALVLGLRYQRLNKADYYYRMHPSGLGNKTANSTYVPDHLRRLDTLIRLLGDRSMISVRFRRILAGNYLWLAQNLMIEGLNYDSWNVWKMAFNSGLSSRFEHEMGNALLWCIRMHQVNLFLPLFMVVMPRGMLIQPSLEPINELHFDKHGNYLPIHFPLRCRLFGTKTSFSFMKWICHVIVRLLRA